MNVLRRWWRRRFSDPQVLILVLLLVVGAIAIVFLGDMLAPVLAAVVIAYLLEALIGWLEALGFPRLIGVWLVFLGFVALLVFIVFGLAPLLTRQITQLVQQLPAYISNARSLLLELPNKYQFVTAEQVNNVLDQINSQLGAFGQRIVTGALTSVADVITIIVFLVLIPVLVFFMMKDKHKIIAWISQYLPRDRHLATKVWHDVDVQIGNYIRGKTVEILIVGAASYVTFTLFKLQYALLLATLVGFSVLIPYIGAAVVTVPIAVVAFFQFGWSSTFAWVMASYGVIQLLDGNALVPLLFSEVVNIHPIAIIVAVLIFGGLGGFWGVFFAIPLATLVNAVLRAIPSAADVEESVVAQPERVSS